MTEKESEGFYLAVITLGIIGGLIGFGTQGTFQGACLGAGIGAAVPIFLLVISASSSLP